MANLKHTFILFLLFPICLLAKYNSEKLDKLWEEKKYFACYKQALKESDKYKDQATPLLYQAACLLQLKGNKQIIAKKKNTVFSVTDLLSKMRSKNPSGDQLKYKSELLRLIQDSLFSEASRRFSLVLDQQQNGVRWSKGKEDLLKEQRANLAQKEAERICNMLHKVFDNKNEVWKNWYGEEFALEGYNFTEFNNPIFRFCNTAKNEKYLSETEKQLYYFTNIARFYPSLFRNTYLKAKYPDALTENSNTYASSLAQELATMKPSPILVPDSGLCKAAEAHALDLGNSGEYGHRSSDGSTFEDRSLRFCAKPAAAENCAYAADNGLDAVLYLLIDNGNSCLKQRYNQLGITHRAGVAHRPHKKFNWVAVIDFQ